MNTSYASTDPAQTRADYQRAVQRNQDAIDAGLNPPFGRGALLVLQRRWEAAEAGD